MQTGTQAIDRAAQLLVLVVESDESSSVGELAEAAGPSQEHRLPCGLRAGAAGARAAAGVAGRHPPGPGAARPGPPRRLRRRHRRALPRHAGAAGRGERRDDRPGGARARRLGAVPRPGRQPALPGHRQLGRTPAAAPLHIRRQGLHGIRRGQPAGAPRAVHPGDDHRPRPRLPKSCAAFARAATRSPSASWSRAWSPWPRPVLGSDGAAIAAISISGPQLRLDGDRLEQLGDLLVSEIAALSERLGHNPRRREPHDTRRDSAGAVREDAGR